MGDMPTNPAAWEVNAGGLMWDALTTAQGKPGSPLKILTDLAPSRSRWRRGLVVEGAGRRRFGRYEVRHGSAGRSRTVG